MAADDEQAREMDRRNADTKKAQWKLKVLEQNHITYAVQGREGSDLAA